MYLHLLIPVNINVDLFHIKGAIIMVTSIVLVLVGVVIGWNTTQPAVLAGLVAKVKGLVVKK